MVSLSKAGERSNRSGVLLAFTISYSLPSLILLQSSTEKAVWTTQTASDRSTMDINKKD